MFVASNGELREKFANYLAAVNPNATYAKPQDMQKLMSHPLVRGLLHSLETGMPYRFIGEAGIGKTSFVKQICRILGLRLVVIPAAQISIENLMLPFPVEDEATKRKILQMIFYKHLLKINPDDLYVIYIDEPGRGDPSIGNTLMELIQEKTLAGRELDGLVTVVATDNPEGTAYGRMASMDFAQADRFFTEILDSNGTPWRYALAEKFAEVDLKPLYEQYDRLDLEVRRVLNPRVLEHLIAVTRAGFPAIYALPVVGGDRAQLINEAGQNVTDTVLGKMCHALGVAFHDSIVDVVERAIKFHLATGYNILFEGPPGIGKTSVIKAILRRLEVEFRYDSAPTLTPEGLSVPFPGDDGTLEMMRTSKLISSTPFSWVVDEVWRCSRRVQAAIMPVLQERENGGEPIENLIGTIALNNPKTHAGMKLDVGKCDLAAASRFALTISITAADLPSTAYLYGKYGEALATPFLDWWKEDLDDVGRALCTPRALERMIQAYAWNGDELDMQKALPYVNGAYVAVPLNDLRVRLQKHPIARLRAIANDEANWTIKLTTGSVTDPAYMEAQAIVTLALQKAEVAQLQELRDLCMRLIRHLTQQNRLSLIRTNGERQQFWLAVVREAMPPNPKKASA